VYKDIVIVYYIGYKVDHKYMYFMVISFRRWFGFLVLSYDTVV